MKRMGLAIAAAGVVLLLAGAAWLWTPDRSLATLEAKYLRSPKDMIEVAGVRLHVRDDGPKAAPAIIMIHGFGASLHTWEPWAQALEPKFRVIRFDLPGSGLSSPDPKGDYTDARTIAVLLALMDRLGVAKASLIGNSIGGRIAWTFAAEHPDRVDKLVLISPDGFASPGFAYGQAPKVPATLGLMRYVLPKSLLRASLKPAYGDPAALTQPTLDRYYELMLAPGVRQALLQRMKETVLVDPRSLLHRIRAPVLLLWGERDGMIPFSNAQAYLQNLPDARLAALPNLGHTPQEEAPAISLRPVEAFLLGDGP
jgi:pimeloyl-ACP methyl ester carboxylesterase